MFTKGLKFDWFCKTKCYYFLSLSSKMRLCAIYADNENNFKLLFYLFCVGLLVV